MHGSVHMLGTCTFADTSAESKAQVDLQHVSRPCGSYGIGAFIRADSFSYFLTFCLILISV